VIVCERWLVDENYETFKVETFGDMPWLVRMIAPPFFRRRIGGIMWAHGIGRHSQEEREGIIAEFVEALEARLGSQTYLHGEQISMIDLTVASFIANALGTKTNPHFVGLVLKSPTLVSYAQRVNGELFPEYKGVLKILDDIQGKLEKKAA